MMHFFLILSLLANITFGLIVFGGVKFIDGNEAYVCKKVRYENYYNKDQSKIFR